MSGTAREEDSHDRDRRKRQKHSGRSEERGTSHYSKDHHERVKLDGTAENDRLIEDVL